MLFPFHIERDVGFELYGDNVRTYVDRILKVVQNPCLGTRLRHPPAAPVTDWRWDDFCKFDLPGLLRLIYYWDPEANYITFVQFGLHRAPGGRNVYRRLALAY